MRNPTNNVDAINASRSNDTTTATVTHEENCAAQMIELAGTAETIDHALDSRRASARKGAQVALTSLRRNLIGLAEALDQRDEEAAAELLELAGVAACIDRALECSSQAAREDA